MISRSKNPQLLPGPRFLPGVDPYVLRLAIRSRRQSLGLSVVEAAKRGEISDATWREIESGRGEITPSVAEGIAEAMGWPVDAVDPNLFRADLIDEAGSVPSTDASAVAALKRLPSSDRLRFEAEIYEAAAKQLRSQITQED